MTELEKLLSHEGAGDPSSARKWSRKTPAEIAENLQRLDIDVSPRTVARLLKGEGYSLKANKKEIPTKDDPERDQQFQVIKSLKQMFQDDENPIISVDTKNRELVGLFKNPGRAWEREFVPVYDHDFPSLAKGIAIPRGLYDLLKNQGHVVVGTSHDTAEFAVSCIVHWWRYRGRLLYPKSTQLLILADAGGSNGYRSKGWKYNLQAKLCDPYELTVTVAHYPTGTSKWNPVEHRLFSEITKRWKAEPLESYDKILHLIGTTKTTTGLTVRSYLDTNSYQTGLKIPDHQMDCLSLQKLDIGPKWNYTIFPR